MSYGINTKEDVRIANIISKIFYNMEITETNKLLDFADFRKYSHTIIESGTGMGGGVERMIAAKYHQILSVEAKDTYYQACCKMFSDFMTPISHSVVILYFGMSKDKFPEMLTDIDYPAVFFLDAHVSGPNSAGHEDYLEKGNASEYAQDNCLTAELKMILAHRPDHVIIIDDQNGENDENVRYREMCLSMNPKYRFYFYDEQRGETFYKNKSLVCVPE